MTKTETAKLFTLLGQFYPNKAPTTELRLAWELALEPYAYEDVRTAAIAYARGNKFFPDLVDITGGLAPAQGSDETPERGARDRSWMRKYILPDNPDSVSRYARERGMTWPQATAALRGRRAHGAIL